MSPLAIEHLQVLDFWTAQEEADRTLFDIVAAVSPSGGFDVVGSVHAPVLQGYLAVRQVPGQEPGYVVTPEGLRAMSCT